MNNLKLLIVISSWLLCFTNVLSQGIKIGETGTSPHPDAGLEIDVSGKGFLMPRLTTAERNAMSSPVQGLQIFNLDTDCIEVFFVNGGWKPIDCGCTSFPDASFSNVGGAINTPVSLSANTVIATNSYSWTFDQGTPVSSPNPTESVTWTSAGTYEVTLEVTDINNCSSSVTQNVVIIPCSSFPDANFSPSSGFVNDPISFTPNSSGPGFSYDWTFQSGTPGSSSAQNPLVEWSSLGFFTVDLTVTDNLGCSSSQSNTIEISACSPDSWIYEFTGSTQTFVVPQSGTYTLEVWGAQGGAPSGNGAQGGYATGETVLTSGAVLSINVGGSGILNNGGFNGGGGVFASTSGAFGGGGASDIRLGGTALTDRIIVAGGGGGTGASGCCSGPLAGVGGGLNGGNGVDCSSSWPNTRGFGGTQSAGGSGSNTTNFCGSVGNNGSAGSLGQGGAGGTTNCCTPSSINGGGGGGGGYYGGGGSSFGGAGGGSSFIGGLSNASTQSGVRTGNGRIIISLICP